MNTLSADFKNELYARNVSKQQADSSVAQAITEIFESKLPTEMIRELAMQFNEIEKQTMQSIAVFQQRANQIDAKLKALDDTAAFIKDCESENEALMDDKAKSAIALYSAVIRRSLDYKADSEMAVQNAGYIVYAYLGGQAKRDIQYNEDLQPSANKTVKRY